MSENAPSQTLAGRYVGPTAATPYRSGKIPHGRTAADRIGADAHVRRRPLDGARSGTDAIRPGIPERATGRRDIRRSPRSVRCPRGAAVASRRYPRVGRSTENSGSGHCRTRRRTPHAAGHGADRISARPTGRGRRSGRPGTVHRRRHRLPCSHSRSHAQRNPERTLPDDNRPPAKRDSVTSTATRPVFTPPNRRTHGWHGTSPTPTYSRRSTRSPSFWTNPDPPRWTRSRNPYPHRAGERPPTRSIRSCCSSASPTCSTT